MLTTTYPGTAPGNNAEWFIICLVDDDPHSYRVLRRAHYTGSLRTICSSHTQCTGEQLKRRAVRYQPGRSRPLDQDPTGIFWG